MTIVTNLRRRVEHLLPGAVFAESGEDWNSIDWRDARPQPSLAAVQAVPETPITAEMVKAEAQRRIIAITGASDLTSCLIKQLNANMRANELNDIQHSRALTAEEEAEANAFRGLAAVVKGIRAASDALESMNPIPSDYATNDSYWP